MNPVERNLKGIELEKIGLVDEAVNLYLENVKENFDGSHPYNRLIAIYVNQNKINEAIEITKRAIYVFENIVYQKRTDRVTKLDRYKKQLSTLLAKGTL
jgi:tetratricopeptide (TPR) repeat protein